MFSGFQYIISFTADSTLQAAFDTKTTTMSLADGGTFFDSCIYAVIAMVPIEFSIITYVVLYFAPGCGVCKRMQPIFQQAATETKGKYVSLCKCKYMHTHTHTLGPLSYCINGFWSAAILLQCLQIGWDVSAVKVNIVGLAVCNSTICQSGLNESFPQYFFPAKPFNAIPQQILHHRFWLSRIITQMAFKSKPEALIPSLLGLIYPSSVFCLQ